MASPYTIQSESRQLLERLLNDPKLSVPNEVKEAAERVEFSGYANPWLPVPVKFSESISAISAFVGASAAAVAKDRYGIEQDIRVNTDHASVLLFGFFLPHIAGESIMTASKAILENLAEVDKNNLFKPIHRASTNQYKTKDGRYYHVHGSMNATVIMDMFKIAEQDVTLEEAKQIYADKVAQYDAEELDQLENEVYRQAGTICYTPEEFFATEHGKIAAQEPIASIKELPAPQKAWPSPAAGSEFRPLHGIRVVDMSRAVAAPMVSKILAALGADVIKVSCPSLPDTGIAMVDVNAGKRDVNIDLKTEEGKTLFRKIIKDADVLVDGYRPHAIEKLGFHSKTLRELNPSLIYVREDCYGYNGPWAHRSGWQQIADCTVGLALMTGEFLGLKEPIQPLLPNADYQTGVLGSGLVIQALMKRTKAPVTFDIDLSLCHYNIWLYRVGVYTPEQQASIRALHPEFKPRHTTDLPEIAGMLMESLKTARPGIFKTPGFYEEISGKEWGEERLINVIGAPFSLTESTLGFLVPSGRRGWSNANPTWVV
ncbi:caib baif family enzyme [Grosmannia clavigera kw1407]|uniref:Caib baif family enzyme n=1 Tax=Grosmannia clavigera (strain kw1407 / UAMH 11150) TaxID=655863 RepID=F0XQP4_GROCL|nr:caib baif family enzyme [Grosmannia clavigera kw1407]EFW99724.1 caib baif family enzyme [Grosmannia clavigera kw1407]